jgi:tellurite resistance protein TerC
MQLFLYLHFGLSAILVFVGLKMILSDLFKVPTPIALGIVVAILAICVVASLIWPQKAVEPATNTGPGDQAK